MVHEIEPPTLSVIRNRVIALTGNTWITPIASQRVIAYLQNVQKHEKPGAATI